MRKLRETRVDRAVGLNRADQSISGSGSPAPFSAAHAQGSDEGPLRNADLPMVLQALFSCFLFF